MNFILNSSYNDNHEFKKIRLKINVSGQSWWSSSGFLDTSRLGGGSSIYYAYKGLELYSVKPSRWHIYQ